MKIRWLALTAVLLFGMLGTTYAGGRYRGGNPCTYSTGFVTGPFGPRPFFGPPVMGYAPWAPVPVVRRTVIYENVSSRSRPIDNVLVQAQRQLAVRGYYGGRIDGDFGPQTARAIRVYQAENGLPVSGRLDQRTLRSLGI